MQIPATVSFVVDAAVYNRVHTEGHPDPLINRRLNVSKLARVSPALMSMYVRGSGKPGAGGVLDIQVGGSERARDVRRRLKIRRADCRHYRTFFSASI